MSSSSYNLEPSKYMLATRITSFFKKRINTCSVNKVKKKLLFCKKNSFKTLLHIHFKFKHLLIVNKCYRLLQLCNCTVFFLDNTERPSKTFEKAVGKNKVAITGLV